MAATVQIREKNGAGETATDKTGGTIRFKNADDANPDTNNQLVVPTTQTEYSFRKVLRLHVTAAGSFTSISNPRFYLDGTNSFGTGRKLWANSGNQGTYVQGTKPSVASDPPVFTGLSTTTTTDAFGYTSGSPKDMDVTNAGPFNNSGLPKDIGDYLHLCAELEVGAASGQWSAESATWAWDET